MDLKIPPEFKQSINIYSNYLTGSYAGRNVKGLFYTIENKQFLANELFNLLTDELFIRQNLPQLDQRDIQTQDYNNPEAVSRFNSESAFNGAATLVRAFRTRRDLVNRMIQSLIEVYQMPFPEDWAILNPVQQLHWINADFLIRAARNIVQDPGNFVPELRNINPDTGAFEGNLEYQYTAESYNDGTWHPEHLFTLSNRNRANPYWKPLEVNYHSDPNAKGPGHRYNDILYNWGTRSYYGSDTWKDGTPKIPAKKPLPGGVQRPQIMAILQQNPGDIGADFSYGQFPDWQTTVNRRQYDKEATIGLRDGGINDRRTQTPGGYDMSKLKKQPSAPKQSRYSRYT